MFNSKSITHLPSSGMIGMKSFKKIFFFFSDEAITFFGSRRIWWVGRKGETNDILF
jgi:hypothetical protein